MRYLFILVAVFLFLMLIAIPRTIDRQVKPYKEQVVLYEKMIDSLKNSDLDLIKASILDAYLVPEPEARVMAYTVHSFCLDFKMDSLWALPVAVLWVESQFKSHLISEKGAKGAGQFMDETAEKEWKKNRLAYWPGVSVFNRTLSVYNCISHLKLGLGIDNDSLDNAIKMYGCGNWQKKKKDSAVYYKKVMMEYLFLRHVYERIKMERGIQ